MQSWWYIISQTWIVNTWCGKGFEGLCELRWQLSYKFIALSASDIILKNGPSLMRFWQENFRAYVFQPVPCLILYFRRIINDSLRTDVSLLYPPYMISLGTLCFYHAIEHFICKLGF